MIFIKVLKNFTFFLFASSKFIKLKLSSKAAAYFILSSLLQFVIEEGDNLQVVSFTFNKPKTSYIVLDAVLACISQFLLISEYNNEVIRQNGIEKKVSKYPIRYLNKSLSILIREFL